jgi:hypothetical protein
MARFPVGVLVLELTGGTEHLIVPMARVPLLVIAHDLSNLAEALGGPP